MWLLSTDRAELHFFPSVQAAQIARFAILSHVWDKTEQTFQETQALRSSWFSNPRNRSSVKVRKSCELAEKHGYKWIWNDACCIDKTSSSELSEAINSMFSYYSHADVCYAYLADVTPDCQPDAAGSQFSYSRWFKRGWTLQELLAPQLVVFLSSSWTMMGTKASLARIISKITEIPETVLLLEEEIWDMSVARRMSWAAPRETTRLEDEAYSLLGIFDINMPTLYGEGRKAFQRLQEEIIMRKSVDPSLFAWGPNPWKPIMDTDAMYRYLLAQSPRQFHLSSTASFSPETLYKIYHCVESQRYQGSGSSREYPSPATIQSTARPSQLAGIPAFDITPYGIRARLPVLRGDRADKCILFISDRDGRHLCLPITKYDTVADPTRPLYHITSKSLLDSPLPVLDPLKEFPQNTSEGRVRWSQFLATPWRTIYFAHCPPQSLAMVRLRMNRDMATPFYIPPGRIAEFGQRHPEMRLDSATVFAKSPTPGAEFGSATLIFKLQHIGVESQIRIHLGRCAASEPPLAGAAARHLGERHWAAVEAVSSSGAARHLVDWEMNGNIAHECSKDHLDDWPNRTRSWRLPSLALLFTLSFAPSRMDPTQYVLTRIESQALRFVYEELKLVVVAPPRATVHSRRNGPRLE